MIAPHLFSKKNIKTKIFTGWVPLCKVEKDEFFFFNLYAAVWSQAPTFPRVLAAQGGSFVSVILIKPLLGQLSETNASRG